MTRNLQPLSILMSISALVLLLANANSTFSQTVGEDTNQVPQPYIAEDLHPEPKVLFKPTGTGEPPTTRGAGSRNDRACSQDNITQPLTLTALVPSDNFGLTWSERPTLWVYLPKTSARQIVLSIREDNSRSHSQRFLSITGEAGILGIQLDQNAPVLAVGKSYQWAVVLVCGDRPSPNDPFVTAWIQRVVPGAVFSQQQSTVERAARYGEQGVWYDALSALVEARRSHPNDSTLTKIWTDFLAQPNVGLEAIANEPLR